MADRGMDRMLRHLNVGFEAAIAREEEEAARDLAYSLLQGFDIGSALRRWGAAELRSVDGSLLPIEELGQDFVAAGGSTLLCPHTHLVAYRAAVGSAPALTDETLVVRLRLWARKGARVLVRTSEGSVFRGRLVRVGPDHFELASEVGSILVATTMVAWVKLAREG